MREVAQQREDRERRQFLADVNRQMFERQQAARAQLADAERMHADVRGKLASINRALDAARSWWQYFTRRELQRRRLVMQAELATADELLQNARVELQQVEEQGGAKFPGTVAGIASRAEPHGNCLCPRWRCGCRHRPCWRASRRP